MNPLGCIKGTHRIITLEMPGRSPAQLLCVVQKDAAGVDGYYVLAECEGALKWRSMIKDNAVRRLRDEFVGHISRIEDADSLDVETIFLFAAEVSKA